MNSLDKFWGIQEQTLKTNVNRKVIKKNFFGHFHMTESIKPNWAKTFSVLIPEVYETPKTNGNTKVLAWFVNFGDFVYPAILKHKKEIIFNFDIEKTINNLIHERYLKIRRPFYTFLPINIQSIPGPTRSFLKKMFFCKGKGTFPSWPIEPSVETLRYVYLKCIRLAGNTGKTKPFWPNKKRYAVILTHDIETKKGFKKIDDFIALEKKYGVQSCINLLGGGYGIPIKDYKKFDSLKFEFGMHGYDHSNKLIFLKKHKILKLLWWDYTIQKWMNLTGFRSPSLLRSPKLFEVLEPMFKWDSSCIDTERGSQIAYANGCCTIFPFYKRGLLEIPITMPQDALGGNINVWLKKLGFIKQVGGMAVFNIHAEPHLSGNYAGLKQYELLLKIITKDKAAWITLPRDLTKWWSKRCLKNVSV